MEFDKDLEGLDVAFCVLDKEDSNSVEDLRLPNSREVPPKLVMHLSYSLWHQFMNGFHCDIVKPVAQGVQ